MANPPFQSPQAQPESGVRGNVPAPFGAGERLQSPTYRYLGGSNLAWLPGGCRVTGIPTAIHRLITRTDGARLLCFLPHTPAHLCYDERVHEQVGAREGAQLLDATISIVSVVARTMTGAPGLHARHRSPP